MLVLKNCLPTKHRFEDLKPHYNVKVYPNVFKLLLSIIITRIFSAVYRQLSARHLSMVISAHTKFQFTTYKLYT